MCMGVCVCVMERRHGRWGGGVEWVTVSIALPCFPLFTARILSACCSLMAFNEPPVNRAPSCFRTYQARASERKRKSERELIIQRHRLLWWSLAPLHKSAKPSIKGPWRLKWYTKVMMRGSHPGCTQCTVKKQDLQKYFTYLSFSVLLIDALFPEKGKMWAWLFGFCNHFFPTNQTRYIKIRNP